MTDFYVDSAVTQDWIASHAYSLGARVMATRAYGTAAGKKYVHECTTAGTSGGTQPTWSTTPAGTTSDGTVTWTTREATTWANAHGRIEHLVNQRIAAGDNIYVDDSHLEDGGSSGGGMNFLFPGTTGSPNHIWCVSDRAEPPVSISTGAVVKNTNTSAQMGQFDGVFSSYGVDYWRSAGGTSMSFGEGNNPWIAVFEACKLRDTSGSGGTLNVGAQSGGVDGGFLQLNNVDLEFSATNQRIVQLCRMEWFGGSLLGSTLPTSLFKPGYFNAGGAFYGGAAVRVKGIDISLLGSGKSLVEVNNVCADIEFEDCKLGASVVLVSASIATPGFRAALRNCDSGDTNYNNREESYWGSTVTDVVLVRTGGASDGVTPIAYALLSTANAKLMFPHRAIPIRIWNDAVGSSKTMTIEFLHDSVSDLNNDDIWPVVEYLGTSGFPKASFASGRKTPLTSPTAWGSSAVTWATAGMSNPRKQKMTVSFTPQEKGWLILYIYLAKSSYSVRVCPKVAVA